MHAFSSTLEVGSRILDMILGILYYRVDRCNPVPRIGSRVNEEERKEEVNGRMKTANESMG
jgi:hypothetical protein